MDHSLTPIERHIHDRDPVLLPKKTPPLPPPPQTTPEELEEVSRHQQEAAHDPVRSIMIKMFDQSFTDDFLKLLPKGSAHLFRPLLELLQHDCTTLLYREKLLHGRPRPKVWAKKHGIPFKAYELNTERNPSYPSYHAATSRLIAHALSEVFPHRAELFEKLAKSIAHSRVDAGVHFPSDIQAGFKWADQTWAQAKASGLRVDKLITVEDVA